MISSALELHRSRLHQHRKSAARAWSEVHKDETVLLSSIAFILVYQVHLVAWALVGVLLLPSIKAGRKAAKAAELRTLHEAEIVAHTELMLVDPDFARSLTQPEDHAT